MMQLLRGKLWARDLGWSLIVSPAVALAIFVYAAIDDPAFILKHLWLYLLGLGVPFTLGGFLIYGSRKDNRRHNPDPVNGQL
jgi:hypothetical protein